MARTKRAVQTREASPAALRSFNPATGQVLGEVPASSAQEVREAVARARRAQPGWAALGPLGRARHLREVRHRTNDLMDDLIDTIRAETGKPAAEALTHDVLPSVLTMKYLEWLAPRALRPERPGRLIAPLLGLRSRIEWRPFGVVGCVTPWNYPMFLSFMAIVPALLAGNAVVLKPSELTPAVGERIRELLEPLPPGVCQVVQGGGEVGAALVDAPCDKLCFVGSAATGRRILEAAARHLTPVVMELGGQDAAIVCADADLDLASSGVLWGAFLNAGQTCCAIERAYVAEPVAEEFERLIVAKLAEVQAGGGDIGPLSVPRQLDVVERHVADAVERGARILAGGSGHPPSRREDGSLWYAPTILAGRTPEMALFREETFGPVLPLVRVRDEDEAVRRVNQDGANLTASVWTRDRVRGRAIAARIRSGTVVINDHATTAGAPWGLWGGVGESGYGRLHGAVGLREFAYPVHLAENVLPMAKRVWWYPYDAATTRTLRSFAEIVSARRWGRRAGAARSLWSNLAEALRGKI